MQGLWIGFGLFIAFMLILIEVRLGSILSVLRELRGSDVQTINRDNEP